MHCDFASLIWVESQALGNRSRNSLCPTFMIDQSKYDTTSKQHHDHPENCRRAVERINTTTRNRHDQRNPQNQIQYNSRTNARGRQRETCIAPVCPSQSHQTKTKRIARRRSTRHQTAKRTSRQLNSKQRQHANFVGILAERDMRQHRVTKQCRKLEGDAEHQPRGLDLAEFAQRITKTRHDRQNKQPENEQKNRPLRPSKS